MGFVVCLHVVVQSLRGPLLSRLPSWLYATSSSACSRCPRVSSTSITRPALGGQPRRSSMGLAAFGRSYGVDTSHRPWDALPQSRGGPGILGGHLGQAVSDCLQPPLFQRGPLCSRVL